MQITAGRVVAFLTPVFAAGSAALTPWLVKYTGLHLTSTQVDALAVAGATAALAPALTWLHGNSLWERAQAEFKAYAPKVEAEVSKVETGADTADPGIVAEVETDVKDETAKAADALVAEIPGAPAEAWPAPAVAVDSAPAEPAAVLPPAAA